MSLGYAEYPDDRLIELTVNGRVSVKDYEAVAEPLQAFLDAHGPVRLLDVVHHVGLPDPAILLPGARFKWRNADRVSHIAVVSDLGWVSPVVRTFGALFPVVMRCFPLAEKEAARAWLCASGTETAAEAV